MKLYLSVDMEGITGLADYTYVTPGERNYESARKTMTKEANAVIEQAVKNGAEEILVNDSHSKMNNIIFEELHEAADLISGDFKQFSMVHGLDSSFDGAIFLGYHSRASMPGVMSHSMSFSVKTMYINDVEIGEIGMNAYVAGYHGIPVIMLAGDDGACREIEALIPGVVTAAVKESISRSCIKTLHPKKARALLAEKTMEAISKKDKIKPLTPPDNPILKMEFNNYGQAEWAALMPGVTILEGTTMVEYKAKDMLEAFRAMLVMLELAYQAKYC